MSQKKINPDLPPELADSIVRLLENKARGTLAARSQTISEGYRRQQKTNSVVIDDVDGLAYVLSRMPATYAASLQALSTLSQTRIPFSPTTLLDVGAGPGTASWAAASLWSSIESVTMVDRSEVLLDLAAYFASRSDKSCLTSASFDRQDVLTTSISQRYDLVVLSYSLTEVDDNNLLPLISKLWHENCNDVLVIVEPGTPRDFGRLLKVRDFLLEENAELVAPCPHGNRCPISHSDWCHFSVRLQRSRDHMYVKQAVMPFEDERFSYVVVSKHAATTRGGWSRIIAQPDALKYATRFRVCSIAGLEERTVAKREKEKFASTKKLGWGDTFPEP